MIVAIRNQHVGMAIRIQKCNLDVGRALRRVAKIEPTPRAGGCKDFGCVVLAVACQKGCFGIPIVGFRTKVVGCKILERQAIVRQNLGKEPTLIVARVAASAPAGRGSQLAVFEKERVLAQARRLAQGLAPDEVASDVVIGPRVWHWKRKENRIKVGKDLCACPDA